MKYQRELFVSQSRSNIKTIEICLKKLAKNINDEPSIKEISMAAHSLEGDSLTAEEYLVAYIASKMRYIMGTISSKKVRLDNEKLSYLNDFFGTFKKAFDNIAAAKKSKIDMKILRKLELLISSNYKTKGVY